MVADYKRRMVIHEDFDRALIDLLQAIRAEGLESIARTDVREQFRRTLAHDYHNLRRYLLFQVWSPDRAVDTYQRSSDAEAILPATFAIAELANGETAVTASEPLSWLLWDPASRDAEPALAAFADEQDERVAHVLMRLQPSAVERPAVVSITAA
jgi:hypothetical protein